jgi:hypothetical protein
MKLVHLFCLFFWFMQNAFADDMWVPVRDLSLETQAGSVLDFSNLSNLPSPIANRVKINSEGKFVLEGKNKPIRFLIGSLGFGVNMGGIPNHALIDAYVKQYKMHGYNMVRLDFVELLLMEGRQADFDYNPEQLDRFHYLVYALKKNGLYLILNGLSNGNGGYGNVQERWLGRRKLHSGVYFDAETQAHWKKLMSTMYGTVNPYTGVSVLKDPTLVGVVLVNEGNLVFLNRHGVAPTFKPYFSDWLKQKYGTQDELKKAWGKELKSTENLTHKTVEFPSPDAWTSKRMADTQQFFFETETATAQWMERHLRSLGFQGVVSSYNLWHSPAAHASRGLLPWVDMHNYFAHPEYLENNVIKVKQDSMLKNAAGYIRELAVSKHLGKPFTVSEHGQVFWNRYRRENALALPAYAAFQDWDGICQHSGAIDLSYAPTVGRKQIIHPFAVGTDPIARATETLAALLYLRGDVTKANHQIGVMFDHNDAFVKSAHLGSMPSDISKLSLVTGLALDWQEGLLQSKLMLDGRVYMHKPDLYLLKSNKMIKSSSKSVGHEIDTMLRKFSSEVAHQARKVSLVANGVWANRVANLRESGWINSQNKTNPMADVYESDTGEILLDGAKKQMQVITDKTEAVVFDQPSPIPLKYLTVLEAQKGALVAVSAMDDKPLANSRRMLLILATDARNSEMQFSDADSTIASSIGKPPVIMLANKVKLSLDNVNAPHLKVYSTNLRGQRMDAIKLKQTSSNIEFELDISKLSHGATTYFEITV